MISPTSRSRESRGGVGFVSPVSLMSQFNNARAVVTPKITRRESHFGCSDADAMDLLPPRYFCDFSIALLNDAPSNQTASEFSLGCRSRKRRENYESEHALGSAAILCRAVESDTGLPSYNSVNCQHCARPETPHMATGGLVSGGLH